MLHKMTATKKVAINIWKDKVRQHIPRDKTKTKPGTMAEITRKEILKCNDITGMSKVVFL